MKLRNATLKDFPKGKLVVLKEDLIVYKRVQGAIVELIIPKGAKAVRAKYQSFENKIRSDVAIVTAIFPYECRYSWSRSSEYRKLRHAQVEFWNLRHGKASLMSYSIGKVVKPHKEFNPDTFDPCYSGIHFFATRKEAENY